MSKIAVFIDGGYLDKILRKEFNGIRIDYDLFPKQICSKVDPQGQLFRTYYYHCLPYKSNPPSQEESARFASKQNFYTAINRLPRFEVRLGKLSRRGPDAQGLYHYEQKMVDVLFSIDLVSLSAKMQISDMVIVAGDSDFVPAIQAAKQEGIIVWLFHGGTWHNELWMNADERIRLDQTLINSVRVV